MTAMNRGRAEAMVRALERAHAVRRPVARWEVHGQGVVPASPEYPPEVRALLREITQGEAGGWMDPTYDPRRDGAWAEDPAVLAALGPPEIRRALTWFVRGERFCDGHWAAVIERGLLPRLAARIRALIAAGAFG